MPENMDFIFADDEGQSNPSRKGMGPLLAIGGLHVPAANVAELERALQSHCLWIGVPPEEQFKWSPGKKEKFQREHLLGDGRLAFFLKLIALAEANGATATVVVTDKKFATARAASPSHE